jgi:uncharacterized protein (TIGR02246 family)
MKIMTLVTALILTASIPALAAPPKETAEDAIKARVAEVSAAFNKGDTKVFAAMCTDDATLINPVGKTAKGPAEIEKLVGDDLATFLKGTTSEFKLASTRLIGKDAAFIDLDQTVTGAKSPDGKTLPPLTFHVPVLLLKKGKVWSIAELRPYAYLPIPPAKK